MEVREGMRGDTGGKRGCWGWKVMGGNEGGERSEVYEGKEIGRNRCNRVRRIEGKE